MTESAGLAAAAALYEKSYHEPADRKFVSYGRLEIIGNHTDHQLGHCIVAGCSLGIKGVAKKSNDGLVAIASEGYARFAFPVSDLTPKEAEKNTSIGLTRGVLAALSQAGYHVGGFRAALNSDIFPGAGVSSSAAYEMFIALLVNALYNEGSIPKIALAKAGQYAENVYFGKASGLLDQTGSVFGGVDFLDFGDLAAVKVEPLPFPQWPLHILLVNSGASHAHLSDLYSEMPQDMKHVASAYFGKEVLSQVSPQAFYARIYQGDVLPERARLRAIHFFEEDARTVRAKEAFLTDNLGMLLEQERASQLSQTFLLRNVMVPGHYSGSPLEAVNRANLFLKKGAARVMGGGLSGSIIAFVLDEELSAFRQGMIEYYGPSHVSEVAIPPLGAHEVVV